MRPTHSVLWRKGVEPGRKLGYAGEAEGMFIFDELTVICSSGSGWDHVSVSHPQHVPTWAEMCQIKDLFFGDDEAVMQLHPPKEQWINNHPRCLHLWRPQDQAIVMPPSWMVGVKELGNLEEEWIELNQYVATATPAQLEALTTVAYVPPAA